MNSAYSPDYLAHKNTAPTENTAVDAAVPTQDEALQKTLALLESTALAQYDRAQKIEAVTPFLGGESYNLDTLRIRVRSCAGEMARQALNIGATLLAVFTVEGTTAFERWVDSSEFPFKRRMAYMFMANSKKVLADQRLFPLLELGIKKAELLLRDISETDAREVTEEGTLHGRPLDEYDAMGRRELEGLLRELRTERDREAKKVEELKAKLKTQAVDHEDAAQLHSEAISALKQEIAQLKVRQSPNDQQLKRIENLRLYKDRMLGSFELCEGAYSGEIFKDAPAPLLIEAHAFYQQMYIAAKTHLIRFERETGYTSESGMDALETSAGQLHIDTIGGRPAYEVEEVPLPPPLGSGYTRYPGMGPNGPIPLRGKKG